MLKKQDGGEVYILNQDLQILADHALKFFISRNILSGDQRDAFEQKFKRALQKFKQDLLLGRDVMIETGFPQTDSRGNIRHGRAMESLLTKDLCRGFENIFSGHNCSLPNGRLLWYDNGRIHGCQGRVQSDWLQILN